MHRPLIMIIMTIITVHGHSLSFIVFHHHLPSHIMIRDEHYHASSKHIQAIPMTHHITSYHIFKRTLNKKNNLKDQLSLQNTPLCLVVSTGLQQVSYSASISACQKALDFSGYSMPWVHPVTWKTTTLTFRGFL